MATIESNYVQVDFTAAMYITFDIHVYCKGYTCLFGGGTTICQQSGAQVDTTVAVSAPLYFVEGADGYLALDPPNIDVSYVSYSDTLKCDQWRGLATDDVKEGIQSGILEEIPDLINEQLADYVAPKYEEIETDNGNITVMYQLIGGPIYRTNTFIQVNARVLVSIPSGEQCPYNDTVAMPSDWPLQGDDGGMVEAGLRFTAEVVECFEWAYQELGLLDFTTNGTIEDANITVNTSIQYPLFDFSTPPIFNFTMPSASIYGYCLLQNSTNVTDPPPQDYAAIFTFEGYNLTGNATVDLNDEGDLIVTMYDLHVDNVTGSFQAPPLPLDSHTLTLMANDVLSSTLNQVNTFLEGNAPSLPEQLYTFIPNPQVVFLPDVDTHRHVSPP